MIEKHYPDLLAGYVLGALDGAEQEQTQAHVAECPDCRNEAASLAYALHATLGYNCPPAAPSLLVRTQFLARLALELSPAEGDSAPARPPAPAEPMIVQTQPPPPPTAVAQPPSMSRQPFAPSWIKAAIALPAIVAIALAIGLIGMKQQFDDQNNHLLGQALTAPHVAMVLSGPAVQRGMTGEVIVPKSGNGGLVILSGMHAAPQGMAYTCWVRAGGQWTAWGPLRPDASGIAMLVMDRSMHASTLAITMEHPDHMASAPSGPTLLGTPL
jgi:anti-sigma factor RsiW